MWELDCEESWVLKNWCFWTVVLEKTLESPLYCKDIQPVHSEGDQPWLFFGGNDAKAETPVLQATSCKELTHCKRLWCPEGLGAGGEGDDRGWDGWMASLTRWMRVWVNSGSWWWTRRPGMLWFMGSQRVGHDWATELNWTVLPILVVIQSLSCILLFDSVDCSMPSSSLLHYLSEFAQIHIHSINDTLILCCPPSPLPLVSPSIRIISNEWALHIRWRKYWSFSFNISPPNEYSGLISFRIDWFDILAVQGFLKSLLQLHNLKASVLWHSAFFMV